MNDMKDIPELTIDENVVLSKYEHPDGETTTDPAFEIERLTISNGEVVSHERIEDGKVVGPVEEGNLTGENFGRLIPQNEEEVD